MQEGSEHQLKAQTNTATSSSMWLRGVQVLPSMGERVTSEFLDNWKKDNSIKLWISVILKIYGRVLGMK